MDRTKISINNKEMDIYVDYEKKNIWLSKKEIALLFDVNKSTINRFFLSNNSLLCAKMHRVGEKMHTVGINGKTYKVDHFNQDVIYEIGYNINPDIARELKGILDELFNNNIAQLTINNSLPLANSYDLVRYENGEILLDVNVSPSEDTVWLNQNDISKLFDTTIPNISMHINNIYESNELEISRTFKDFLIVQNEGGRKVERLISYYNLDMIISIGYRVNTKRGIDFRRWATTVLKNYLLNGYSINEKKCLECSENIKSLNNKVDYLLTKDIDKDNRIQDLEKESNNYKDILFGKNYEYIEKGDIPTSIITFNRITKISKNNIKIVDRYIDSDVIDFLKAYTSTKFILFTSNNKLKDLTIPENISIRYGSTLHSRYIFVDDKYSYLLTCSMNTIGKNDYEIEFLDGLDPFDILKKI